ncbi:hypothetical protein HDK77DRAFT_382195 [Phyllosticta capitalensis]|uniref:Uncharacterized protein n=1 Tax=Phyllosticta capitalensis TaxID=121624 RepID=A0ABR1YQ53_9PEZI
MLSYAWYQFPNLLSSQVKVPKEKVCDFEEKPEKNARALKHLLQENHTQHAVIYHNLEFHNHMPHILGSAFILGSNPDHLREIFKAEAETLEPWTDSPGEITEANWREHLGNKHYQRAYMDFFEDQLAALGNDWKKLVEKFLLSGKEPLINNLICGLGHPMIHMHYAYELSSKILAPEALTLSACFHNSMHVYLDDPSYTKPPVKPTEEPMAILNDYVRNDKRFDNVFQTSGDTNTYDIFDKREGAVLEYWNDLVIKDATALFKKCQKLAVGLVVATHQAGQKYDFFLVHGLTTSHAVRHLLPQFPAKYHVPLVRQWWLFVIATYISQLRPEIDLDRIEKFDRQERDWDFVVKQALEGHWRNDAHYVKALRAMKSAAETWGDEEFYLKAAVKFATEFGGWGGFGVVDQNADKRILENRGDADWKTK